jgi:hypothetical protein
VQSNVLEKTYSDGDRFVNVLKREAILKAQEIGSIKIFATYSYDSYSNDETTDNACFETVDFLLLRLGRGPPPRVVGFLRMFTYINDITTCDEETYMGMEINTFDISSFGPGHFCASNRYRYIRFMRSNLFGRNLFVHYLRVRSSLRANSRVFSISILACLAFALCLAARAIMLQPSSRHALQIGRTTDYGPMYGGFER